MTIGDVTLAAAAYVLLGIARAAVLAVPFSWIARALGAARPNRACSMPVEAGDQHRIRAVALAIVRAAHRTPWRSNCLAQALTAHMLLVVRRIPHVVHLGVARQEEQPACLAAHAWVEAGGQMVTGGREAPGYTVVASFERR